MYKYLGTTGIKMYDLFNFISIIALLAMNMSLIKEKSIFLSGLAEQYIRRSKRKNRKAYLYNRTLVTIVEIFLISLVQYGFVSIFTSEFGKTMDTGNNYFAVLYFVPVILMAYFYFIKISPLRQLDMITPAYAIALVFVKLACFCSGCCNGIEYEHGLLNEETGLLEFPVQLLEAALALALFIFLVLYRKKAKEGTLYPIFLTVYSGVRFFIEFLRHEENVFLIFKTYHILCLIGVILGIAEYFAVTRCAEKIKKLYDTRKLYH